MQAFADLESRDDQLGKIRDGELQAVKKPKSTPITKREAFDKYLKIFYNRTFVTVSYMMGLFICMMGNISYKRTFVNKVASKMHVEHLSVKVMRKIFCNKTFIAKL